MTIFKVILILVLSFLINFSYAQYIKNVTKSNPFKAILFGEFVTIAMAINVINYVDNHYYLIPVIIGGSIGTYISVKRKK